MRSQDGGVKMKHCQDEHCKMERLAGNPDPHIDNAELKQLLGELWRGIQWKSCDKDNMEFKAVITCYQKDAIDKELAQPVTAEMLIEKY